MCHLFAMITIGVTSYFDFSLAAVANILVRVITCTSRFLVPYIIVGLLVSMLEQGGGVVVVISSLQGKMGLPCRSSCE